MHNVFSSSSYQPIHRFSVSCLFVCTLRHQLKFCTREVLVGHLKYNRNCHRLLDNDEMLPCCLFYTSFWCFSQPSHSLSMPCRFVGSLRHQYQTCTLWGPVWGFLWDSLWGFLWDSLWGFLWGSLWAHSSWNSSTLALAKPMLWFERWQKERQWHKVPMRRQG